MKKKLKKKSTYSNDLSRKLRIIERNQQEKTPTVEPLTNQDIQIINHKPNTQNPKMSCNSKMFEVQFNAIPEFTGKNDFNPISFIKTFENFKEQFECIENQKRSLFEIKIKTEDISFMERLSEICNYHNTKKCFLEYYWDKPTQRQVYEQFKKSVFYNLPPKQIQQMVEKYVHLLTACDKLTFDITELRNEFIQKMPCTWQSIFYSSRVTDLKEITKVVNEWFSLEIGYAATRKPKFDENKDMDAKPKNDINHNFEKNTNIADSRCLSWQNQNNPTVTAPGEKIGQKVMIVAVPETVENYEKLHDINPIKTMTTLLLRKTNKSQYRFRSMFLDGISELCSITRKQQRDCSRNRTYYTIIIHSCKWHPRKKQ